MKQQWEKFVLKIDSLSLRERLIIFAAIVFALVASVKIQFLDTFLLQQKKLTASIAAEQGNMRGLQAQIDASLQARKGAGESSQQHRLEQIQQQLEEGNAFLQSRRDRLVAPEEMTALLEQVLARNGGVQLIHMRNLPPAPLLAGTSTKPPAPGKGAAVSEGEIFKHGVEITLRGGYLDLLQYLTEVESSPKQVFWGQIQMTVVRYPVVELSLTVYTLSLEKTWLQI